MVAGFVGDKAVILVACGPYLLAFPGIALMQPQELIDGAVAAFVMGVLGYSCLTLFLWMAAVTKFDQMANRRDGGFEADEIPGRLNRLTARRQQPWPTASKGQSAP
jgi:hypothetical protein